jgi:hypothetical protein
MCVDIACEIPIRKVVNLGLLRNTRLERTFNRVTSQIISTRPSFLFQQDLRVLKVLFRKSLKQLPIETNHAKGLARASYCDCAESRAFKNDSTLLLSINVAPVSTKVGIGEKESCAQFASSGVSLLWNISSTIFSP